MTAKTLLAGPDLRDGAESFRDHTARLGALPHGGEDLIPTLERSQLRGRGGAGFPVGVKWRSVASAPGRRAVVLVNGAEGEPLSRKDRLLMEGRPHLVLDGAALAAEAVGAAETIIYVGAEHAEAHRAVTRALGERPDEQRRRTRMVSAAPGYVSGEESAAVHFLNRGVALPTATLQRPAQKGVDGRPTLVKNIESLAHAALIARRGDEWFPARWAETTARGRCF